MLAQRHEHRPPALEPEPEWSRTHAREKALLELLEDPSDTFKAGRTYVIPYFISPLSDIPVDIYKNQYYVIPYYPHKYTELRMEQTIFFQMGEQLRLCREKRGWTQPDIATRVGRSPARISELENDLLKGRFGRDRLTLFAEMCDALNLVPILVPRDRAAAVRGIASEKGRRIQPPETPGSAFDDLFIDLGDSDGPLR